MLMEVWGALLIALAMACLLCPPYDAARKREAIVYVGVALLAAVVGAGVAWAIAGALSGNAWSASAAYAPLMGLSAGIAAAAALASTRVLPTFTAAICSAAVATALINMTRAGWLSSLGADASLGHGAIDLSGLAVLGLTIAGVLGGRRAVETAHPTPRPAWLERSASRLILSTILSATGFALISTQVAVDTPNLFQAQIIGAALTCGAALLSGLAYGWFVTGSIDSRFGSQAMLGALIGASSIALIPTAVALPLGVLCALAALPVGEWLRERAGLRDAFGWFGALGIPALLGVFATGLIANGSFLAGWNGVGADSYLNISGIGVVGWLTVGDVGQFSAQIVLAAAALGSAAVGSATSFRLLARIAPLQMVESSTSTALETPKTPDSAAAQSPDPDEAVLDGDSLSRPRKTLGETRAYRVAYPFRNRGARKRTEFVVRDDDSSASGS
jgi:hypothetical protein